MSIIQSAKAYCNNEVAFIAWSLKSTLNDCLGFEVTRIYKDTQEQRVIAAWVPFKGQSNPKWLPQTTAVWPVHKLTWRDLTVRKKRDDPSLRPSNIVVSYRIRPLVKEQAGLEKVTNVPKVTYTGDPLPL